MFEDLLERPPAHLVVTADLALGDPLDEHLSPDLCPQLHVCVHPSPVLLAGPSEGASERASGPTGMSGAVVFDDHNPVRGAVVFGDRSHGLLSLLSIPLPEASSVFDPIICREVRVVGRLRGRTRQSDEGSCSWVLDLGR